MGVHLAKSNYFVIGDFGLDFDRDGRISLSFILDI